jgi:hypothetical protein
MVESLLSFLSKLGSSFAGRLIDSALERFKRPQIQLKRAPENIFQYIAPGTSLARTREVLGVPHREDGNVYSFAFRDAHVQIGSSDSQSVEWIAVVLPQLKRGSHFPLGFGPLVLGKSTLGDVLALDSEAQVKRDFSTKHWCFWTECYFGFSGLYRHYLFGVIEAPCALPPEFEWDHANDRLKSDPKTVRFNWAAVSTSPGAEFFDFWAFV